MQEFKALRGRFTLSDDSHGISQVGLNYNKVLECIKKAGITEICHLVAVSDSVKAHDQRFAAAGWKIISVEELEGHGFWKKR